MIYDSEGQLLSGSFQDYSMPRANDFPEFTTEFLPILATGNPFGDQRRWRSWRYWCSARDRERDPRRRKLERDLDVLSQFDIARIDC